MTRRLNSPRGRMARVRPPTTGSMAFGSVEDFREAWASTTFEAEEFIPKNDAVVVPLLFHLRAQSGVELDVEEAWVYWVRNGKIWRMEQHASKQEALEAAGLSE
jgi:ketosteroid isomerase-like protein